MRALSLSIKPVAVSFCAGPASAHVSEQGFVLLLPTGLYTAAGVSCVVATVLLLVLIPSGTIRRVFRPVPLWRIRGPSLRPLAQAMALAFFGWLIWIGLNGSRDPLSNALPLTVWTVWWIGMVSLQGLVGDLWRWTSPFAILAALGRSPLVRTYPRQWGHVPALCIFLAFAGFVLADPAPSDPARLAFVAGGYWALTAVAVVAFGPRWLLRGEALTVLMRSYARQSPLGRRGNRMTAGWPGWKIARGPLRSTGAALFVVLLLGTGSFDGLNETFWWLGLIGINPLEFPGRSAVVVPTLIGLLVANGLLIVAFLACLWVGLRLARAALSLGAAFRLFAPALLPIALGYHIAHYLTAFLVDGQYALAALSDPLARGDDLLGLGTFYVTTGFFNTQGTVRAIWLTQAGAVVIGHVLAVLLSDALAVRAFATRRQALLSQLPLVCFMIAYTLFGLWLLASPRGL